MTAADQLQMFEPHGDKLAELVSIHSRTAQAENQRAQNLTLAGFCSAAASRLRYASQAEEGAAVCEMALQFERLAGLA